MNTSDDPLAEFDEPVETHPEDDLPHDLPAAIADPKLQEAVILNPKSGLTETAPSSARPNRLSRIPMPVRSKAFFLWIECGTYVEVAARLGMTTESIKKLSETDGWQKRAEELRVGLDETFRASVLLSRQRAAQLIGDTLSHLSPEKISALLDGKDIVRLLTAMVKSDQLTPPGLNVQTGDGPVQINTGGLQPSPGGLSHLSDEELARLAREKGIEVQAAPRAVSGPPPSLPGTAQVVNGSGDDPGD